MGVLALLVLRSIVQHKQYREFVWSFQERIGPSNRMMAVSTKDPRGARWEKSAQNQMQRAPYAPLLRELWQLAAIGTWQACPAPVTFCQQMQHSPKYYHITWQACPAPVTFCPQVQHTPKYYILPDRPVLPRWPFFCPQGQHSPKYYKLPGRPVLHRWPSGTAKVLY